MGRVTKQAPAWTLRDGLAAWDEEHEQGDLEFYAHVRKAICGFRPSTFRRLYEVAQRHRATMEEATLWALSVRGCCRLDDVDEPEERSGTA